jgi:hypothetical protein
VFPAHGDGEAYQVHSQCQLMMFQKWHWEWIEGRKPFPNLGRKARGLSFTLQRLQGPAEERNELSPMSEACDFTAWACKEIYYKLGSISCPCL